MTRAKILHQNPGHELAEQTVFVSRLRFKKEGDVALKSDCINLAIQYVAVYQAMERRLGEIITDNTPYLAVFNQAPWSGRSSLLQEDILEMKAFVSDDEQKLLITDDTLFPATKEMVADIEQADAIKLYSWLAVRCLGDAFGGQGLKGYNQRIFGEDQLTAKFAAGVSREAHALCREVNHAVMTGKEEGLFYSTADLVFKLHGVLFEQMEAERILPDSFQNDWQYPEMQTESRPLGEDDSVEEFAVSYRKSRPANYSNGCRLMMFAAVAVASTAVAIGTAYSSMTSPQQ